MRSKAEVVDELAAINRRISELDEQMKRLCREKDELEEELHNTELSERTIGTLQRVHSVTNDNALRVRLNNSTKTTPIMDRFMYSDEEFLIIDKAFFLSNCRKYVSLVVIKNNSRVNYDYTGLTMTNLKEIIGSIICEDRLSFTEKSSREYPLIRELILVDKQSPNSGDAIPFSTPCLLGGQTYKDQKGFGSEYCGEYLVYQGKNYGETTKFLIIGALIGDFI